MREQGEEAYYEEASRDIAAFFVAVQSGRRNAWIGQFFSPQFGRDLNDEAIVYDILALHKRKVALSIAECLTCGRLWLQRGPHINEYRSYAPDVPGYAAVLQSGKQVNS